MAALPEPSVAEQVHDIAMGDADALGRAAGTRGVHHVDELIGVDGDHRIPVAPAERGQFIPDVIGVDGFAPAGPGDGVTPVSGVDEEQ